jgi:hypothetical protein
VDNLKVADGRFLRKQVQSARLKDSVPKKVLFGYHHEELKPSGSLKHPVQQVLIGCSRWFLGE